MRWLSRAVVASLTLSLVGAGTSAQAASEPHISVIVLQGSAMSTLEAMLPQFEQRYHIHVQWTAEPYSAMHEKEISDFIAHTDRYDVVMMDNPWLAEYASGRFLMNLLPFLRLAGYKVSLDLKHRWPPSSPTFPTIKADGFITPMLNFYGNWKGGLYVLPWMPGIQMLYYRKDLFDNKANQAAFRKEYGYPLAVPRTWKQLADVARFFTDPAKKMYGLTWSGYKGNEASQNWMNVAWSMGCDSFAFGQGFPSKAHPLEDMPVINNPICLKALKFWVGLKAYMPPGAGEFHWAEITPEYTTGHAAMMLQWSDFVSQVITSPYAKDTGYAVLPGDPGAPAHNVPGIVPGRGYASLGGWGIGINADTHAPQAAWQFVQWATSLTMTPAQRLHYENAAFTGFGTVASFKNPATLGYKSGRFPVEYRMYLHHIARRPEIPTELDWETIVGDNAQLAFLGSVSPQQALATMQHQLYNLMVQSGYIPASMPFTWPSAYVNRNGTKVVK